MDRARLRGGAEDKKRSTAAAVGSDDAPGRGPPSSPPRTEIAEGGRRWPRTARRLPLQAEPGHCSVPQVPTDRGGGGAAPGSLTCWVTWTVEAPCGGALPGQKCASSSGMRCWRGENGCPATIPHPLATATQSGCSHGVSQMGTHTPKPSPGHLLPWETTGQDHVLPEETPKKEMSDGGSLLAADKISSHISPPASRRTLKRHFWSSRCFSRLKMRVLDQPGALLGLLLLLVAPGQPTVGGPQAKVDCICHNDDYVICDWGSREKPHHNYSFSSRYASISQTSECTEYIQKERLNVACRLSEYDLFHYLDIYLNDSQGQVVTHQNLQLKDLVRPGKPFNLTLQNQSNHQLLLTWKTPYQRPDCLEHIVRYKSNKDTEFMELPVQPATDIKFQIPSVDPEKRYTFYVKSKLHKTCASTNLWSEESEPAFWGKEDAHPSLLSSTTTILIPLGSFLLLMLLLLALLRMERVWVVLMPRIPNPSKKFEDLFTAYQGNFSEWAGVPKDVVETFKPTYYENICAITELLPSGGYLSESSDPPAKSGEPSDVLPDPPPKAKPGPAEVTT
ncbi:cytokine receptor common subunit gamma isoform X2 [Thamnophis elegans]|uniref:cytokine receptor common subunit gamma isoform X2 n=1 Tax=Thamnophis elegans TaxID=35005 RepID=UPI0013780B68|nr:cytokine receptor common subunit gamma isoform X2 [Thamnophis elegans]